MVHVIIHEHAEDGREVLQDILFLSVGLPDAAVTAQGDELCPAME
ncbi:hypothetical protein ACFSC4_27600 [Deinococcus malanensis]